MSDTAPEQTEAPVETAQVEAEKPAKAPKVVKEPNPCFCQAFEVADPNDTDSVFNTGCEQTTKSTFAQGHDARLVSFLVDGHFDGYEIRSYVEGKAQVHSSPAEAAALASDALGVKAASATNNRAARLAAKTVAAQTREAKKAATAAAKQEAKEKAAAAKAEAKGPKATGAEKVAGSTEGDSTPLGEGQVKIKVGRYEYNAMVNDEGEATYTTGSGEVKTVERDGYRLLQEATA